MDAPSLFASLSSHPRPPTPPQASHDDKAICDTALAMLSSNILLRPFDTPDESPASYTDSVTRSTERGARRVKFTPTPSNIEDTENIGSTPASKSSRVIRPVRSILKRSGSLLSSDPLSSDPIAAPLDDRDFPTMLEDMMTGLSSPEVSTRYDAYMVINRCLKQYKDMPSRQSLVDKLPSLTGHIQRHMSETNPAESTRASQVVLEATRLATTLIWSDPTKSAMPLSFQSFILNHSINAVSKPETSKNLLNQYLFLLSTQEFGPKAMNRERANRLLSALQKLEERVKSKSASAHKLAIYKRLLSQEQARIVMIARANEWMSHLFNYLFSSIKEIRSRAIDFGLAAGRLIGSEIQVSKAFRDLFRSTQASGESTRTYTDIVTGRLLDWIASKDECMQVTQIWSIGVFFMRNKEYSFEKWRFAPQWLRVIQACFNSSDSKLKCQANVAWTRFIFAISPDGDTSPKIASLLLSPLESQMRRATGSKQESKDERRVAYAAYCTLLYYAFRPGVDHETLDRYWNLYVVPILTRGKSSTLVETDMTCRILTSLLNGNSSQPWDIERVNKANLQKPEEVPGLDVKWVRSRAGLVAKLLEPLSVDECWVDGENGPRFEQLWSHFTKALGQAGQKEVKVSVETLEAIAGLVASLHRILITCHTGNDERTYEKFIVLLREAVKNIGLPTFVEKRFVHSTAKGFALTETPSSRVNRASGSQTSSLLYLLSTLVSGDVNAKLPHYDEALRTVLDLTLASATSTASKTQSIREFAEHLNSASSATQNILWDILAEALQDLLETCKINSKEGEAQEVSQIFRRASDILTLAPWQATDDGSRTWYTALDALNSQVQAVTGPVGFNAYFLEPLACHFSRELDQPRGDNLVEPALAIVSKVKWPVSHTSSKQVQRRLPGSLSKPKEAGCPTEVYALISSILRAAYVSSSITAGFKLTVLNTVRRVFDQCPVISVKKFLEQSCPGLAAWMEDVDGVLVAKDVGSQRLFKAAVGLWATILAKVGNIGTFDTSLLASLEGPLKLGFISKHKAIVNLSVDAWNTTFGAANHLKYPEQLREPLLRLKFQVDIQLPGLVREYDSQLDTPLEFADTPEDPEQLPVEDDALAVAGELQDQTLSHAKETSSRSLPTPIKTPEPSPRTKRIKLANRATPRLRHDNSQIEFAPIDSSPSLLGAIDSQLLTDRQKEVKERQNREAAAIFPDLKSTPKATPSAHKETPRLQLSQRDRVEASGGAKELISPTLPPTDKMTPFLGSSPTPSQRSSSSQLRCIARPKTNSPQQLEVQLADLVQDLPSSPPSVAVENVTEFLVDQSHIFVEQRDKMQGIEHGLSLEEQAEQPRQVEDITVGSPAAKSNNKEDSSCVRTDRELSRTGPDALVHGERREQSSEANERHHHASPKLAFQHNHKATGDLSLDEIFSTSHPAHSPATSHQDLIYTSDYDDLVSSQIARELESASQDTVVYPSPSAMDPTTKSNSAAMSAADQQAPKKKRGRPTLNSRKRKTLAEEEAESDTIVVASSSASKPRTHGEGHQRSGNARGEASTITKVEQEPETTNVTGKPSGRPKKKAKTRAASQFDTDFMGHLLSLYGSSSEANEPDPAPVASLPQPAAKTNSMVAQMEAILKEAKQGIPADEKMTILRLAGDLISVAAKSAEGEKTKDG